MDAYVTLKWLHIIGATVLFGTGLGTAFHFWLASRSGRVDLLAAAARSTVIADYVFIMPAVVAQPLTGIALAVLAGYPLSSLWIVLSVALYFLVGACWIPVVFIQIRIRDLAARLLQRGEPPDERLRALVRAWLRLGWPAFAATLAILWLMVARPA